MRLCGKICESCDFALVKNYKMTGRQSSKTKGTTLEVYFIPEYESRQYETHCVEILICQAIEVGA